jgi:hypothetical protein
MRKVIVGLLIATVPLAQVSTGFAQEILIDTPELKFLEKFIALQDSHLNPNEFKESMIQIVHDYETEASPADAENNWIQATKVIGIETITTEEKAHEFLASVSNGNVAHLAANDPFDVWGCLGRSGLMALALTPATAMVAWPTYNTYKAAYDSNNPNYEARNWVPVFTLLSGMVAIIVPTAIAGACLDN